LGKDKLSSPGTFSRCGPLFSGVWVFSLVIGIARVDRKSGRGRVFLSWKCMGLVLLARVEHPCMVGWGGGFCAVVLSPGERDKPNFCAGAKMKKRGGALEGGGREGQFVWGQLH